MKLDVEVHSTEVAWNGKLTGFLATLAKPIFDVKKMRVLRPSTLRNRRIAVTLSKNYMVYICMNGVQTYAHHFEEPKLYAVTYVIGDVSGVERYPKILAGSRRLRYSISTSNFLGGFIYWYPITSMLPG